MVYMYHSFLVHSSADGHLGCFSLNQLWTPYQILLMYVSRSGLGHFHRLPFEKLGECSSDPYLSFLHIFFLGDGKNGLGCRNGNHCRLKIVAFPALSLLLPHSFPFLHLSPSSFSLCPYSLESSCKQSRVKSLDSQARLSRFK